MCRDKFTQNAKPSVEPRASVRLRRGPVRPDTKNPAAPDKVLMSPINAKNQRNTSYDENPELEESRKLHSFRHSAPAIKSHQENPPSSRHRERTR